MEDRVKERDSIRAAKKLEYEERRQRLIDERNARRDSLLEERENKKNPPAKSNDAGKEDDED